MNLREDLDRKEDKLKNEYLTINTMVVNRNNMESIYSDPDKAAPYLKRMLSILLELKEIKEQKEKLDGK